MKAAWGSEPICVRTEGMRGRNSISAALRHCLDLHRSHGLPAQAPRRVEVKSSSVSDTAVGNIPHQTPDLTEILIKHKEGRLCTTNCADLGSWSCALYWPC